MLIRKKYVFIEESRTEVNLKYKKEITHHKRNKENMF